MIIITTRGMSKQKVLQPVKIILFFFLVGLIKARAIRNIEPMK